VNQKMLDKIRLFCTILFSLRVTRGDIFQPSAQKISQRRSILCTANAVQKYFAQNVSRMLANDLNRSKTSESVKSDSRQHGRFRKIFASKRPAIPICERQSLLRDVARGKFPGRYAATNC